MKKRNMIDPNSHYGILLGALGHEIQSNGVRSVTQLSASIVEAHPAAETDPRLKNIVAALDGASARLVEEDTRIQFQVTNAGMAH